MIVAFTGHRPDKIGFWDLMHPDVIRVRHALRDVLVRTRPLYAISGMALGVDQWAAETCVEVGIPFVAALPCDAMEATWPPSSQARWRTLLTKAVEVHVVSPGPYKPWKMQRRNEWMVDHCSTLLAAWDGSPGGTRNCLVYAEQVKREIIRIEWRKPLDVDGTLVS